MNCNWDQHRLMSHYRRCDPLKKRFEARKVDLRSVIPNVNRELVLSEVGRRVVVVVGIKSLSIDVNVQ